MDTDFSGGTATAFARSVAAQVRSEMAARRMSIRAFAKECGFSSHNYLAIRLRDEKPLTLDDVDAICGYLGEDPQHFVTKAADNHLERIWSEALYAKSSEVSDTPTPEGFALAAHDEQHTIHEEQEADDYA